MSNNSGIKAKIGNMETWKILKGNSHAASKYISNNSGIGVKIGNRENNKRGNSHAASMYRENNSGIETKTRDGESNKREISHAASKSSIALRPKLETGKMKRPINNYTSN